MKTKTITLELTTDYSKTGNNTNQQIDTLAIAVEGRDYNDIWDYNFDWFCEVENGAKKEWLDNDAEDYFQRSLTKEKAAYYADHLDEYETALDEYRDTFESVTTNDYDVDDAAQSALAHDMQKALDDTEKELRHDWLYGDYHGNFDGILPKVNKRCHDYGIELDYDQKTDTITATISDNTIASLLDDGYINDETLAAVKTWLEKDIDSDAMAAHNKNKEKAEKNRIAREEKRAYEQKVAEDQKNSKRAELLKIAE